MLFAKSGAKVRKNPYVLYITYYQLNITNYDLQLTLYPLTLTLGCSWGVFVLRRKIIKMNKYYDPKLSHETLETYQGYSLQVFKSSSLQVFTGDRCCCGKPKEGTITAVR